MEHKSIRPSTPLLVLSSSQIELLKILAVVFMVIDHANRIFYHTQYFWMITIGRLAFPLFCFIIAYHYEYHVRNFKKYIGLLLIFGIISQPIYEWALFPKQLNIFFTLLLGLLCIWIYDHQDRIFEKWRRWQRTIAWMIIGCGVLLSGFIVDYNQPGILLIPALVLWLRYQTGLILFSVMLTTIAANSFYIYSIVAILAYFLVFLIALVPVRISRLPRYFYYGFYPAHLIALKLIAVYALAQ